MSIDAKIAEIMEESKLLGLVEEELDEAKVNKDNFQGDEKSSKANKDNYKNIEAVTDSSNTDGSPNAKKVEKELKIKLKKESFDLEDYSIEELEDFMMSEDFEQLDELSKKTLGSYVKKADKRQGQLRKIAHQTMNQASDQEEEGNHKEVERSWKHHDRIVGKINKKAAGIKLATKKLAKESIDVSADVDALMFGESLSEEFREKAATIFESAVVVRVKEEVTRLEEEFEEKLAEQVDSITEGLVEKIDGYLDYVVEQWIENNEIALEHGLKSDIMESFITGMKGLFEEHYIDVPEEKYDVIGEMEAKIDTLESKLDEQFERNVELKKSLSESVRKEIVSMVSEGLTSTETEKFTALVEELSYDDEDSFKVKVQTIRENYFTGKSSSNRLLESVVTDSPVEEINESKYTNIDPTVAAYAQALKQYNN
ncbi:prohead core protein [uncultured Caudovirales phage]|uniref:Prohead core protein n=1 Tax=uncultured Caudovirales phage TaxID=2100421 RepID=A0A6J5L1F0_9CAUD|nr:prohead core protein [uncultured Caudovirales phage]